MSTTKIAGAAAALALIAAPATAAAHDGQHHGRHHHHVERAHVREVTGAATATVATFAGGDLTLALPSGRTFTAAVTQRTEITCATAAPQAATARHGGGDDPADHDAGDDHGDDAPNHDAGDDNGSRRCDASNLVAGARVSVAKLSLRGGDGTWKKVVIVK
jgi:hypothetical protein